MRWNWWMTVALAALGGGLLAASLSWAADPALREKAQAYDQGVRDRHVPGEGGVVQVVYEDDTLQQPLMYKGQGDSTMWTSTYAAAQAFRYAVDGEVEARANAIAAVQTLYKHLRVTQTTGYVARYVGPIADPAFWLDYYNSELLRYGTGVWTGYFYLSNSSSDQYDGFFHGLSIVHELVDDAATRALIRSMIKEVIDKLRDNFWLILNEDGVPTTAAPQIDGSERVAFALIAARLLDTDEYWTLYDQVYAQEQPGLPLSSDSFFSQYMEYFANNLRHQNFESLLTLDPDEARGQFYFDVFVKRMRRWVEWTHNVYFDWVYLAACERRSQCRDSLAIMTDGVNALTAFQAPPNREIHVDPPPAEIDPVSQRLVDFQESLPDWLGQYLDFELQAKTAYAIPDRCREDFLWQRSPFQMQCGGYLPQHVLPGVDYLLAYWMGRYYGYLDPHDIDPPAGDDDDVSPGDDDNDNNDGSPDDDDNDDHGDDDAATAAGDDDDSSGCGC